ncbi:MAG: LicD family protein, partial [Lachnospiraceae bacterium]|nr:LicD family protein [Lachnospiraceae bacterium]
MNPRIYEKELEFPKEYFLTETRDGFLVPALMKHFWAAQMEVLRDISLVCEKYDIPWYADYGTMIGVVRHKGFIPWDDDLDICMLRPDYDRFLKVAVQELPAYYKVLHMDLNKEYTDPMIRVTNGQVIPLDKEKTKKFHGFPLIAGVDIFPLDYLYPDAEKEEERRLRALALEKKISTTPNAPWELYKELEGIYSEYKGEGSTHIGMMRFWVPTKTHKYPIESLKAPVWMDFETVSIPMTAMYDKILVLDYGTSYIEAIQVGGLHDYPVYHSQVEEVAENWGYDPYDPTPSAEEVDEATKNAASTFFEDMPGQVALLRKAQGMIAGQLAGANYENAATLLMSCQNLAIKIGTLMEGNIGKDLAAVRVLEEYCEEIYAQYVLLQGGETAGNASAKHLDELVERFVSEWEKIAASPEQKQRRIVLFLPYRAQDWAFLKSCYEKEMEDPDCDVYVIAVPFFFREEGKEPELISEEEKFPEGIDFTPFDQYDFVSRRTDVVYFTYPFDDKERELSIHPFFYAKAMRKYVKRMVYVPTYRFAPSTEADGKAMHNIKEFAKAPAGVYADEIVVGCRDNADIFADVLEGLKGLGEIPAKTYTVASKAVPLWDPAKEYPQEWIQKKSGKKVVLYHISESILAEEKQAAIEKAKRALQIFE